MKKKPTQILVISRDKAIHKRFESLFTERDYVFSFLQDLDRVIKFFESITYDLLILSDEVCNDGVIDYRDLLAIISKESPQTQILFLVGAEEISLAVNAMEDFNYKYIRTPAPDEEIILVVDLILNQKQDYGKNKLLSKDEAIYRFEEFIGGSSAMQKVYRQIQQVAPTNFPVLLLGETGTGKDLAARAIHRLSLKSNGPYIPVNLGAHPAGLIGSELFGHEKGSFTGASRQHLGVFESATDGTVFMDEIESIDNKVQVSLLRLIEQKKLTRLGGRRQIKTNARLIAASNENLEELVHAGKFREDLFFRLDVFRIVLPPLRERVNDISLIAEELISSFSFELNKNINRITSDCIAALQDYDWPGNVRELRNVIQRAVLVCEDEQLTEKHLPERIKRSHDDPTKFTLEIGKSLKEVEKNFIQRTLAYTKNNRTQAAELLGITRRALYNKLHKHNIL